MPKQAYEDDEPDEYDDSPDPEDPGESDMDDDDEPATVPCPYCRAAISEDADLCPRCGNFIVSDDAPKRFPAWVWVGLILCVLMMLTWIFLPQR